MISISTQKPMNPSSRRGMSATMLIWSAVLVMCFLALIYLASAPGVSPPHRPPSPQAVSPGISSQARARFYDEQVQPAIALADTANREAAERCVQRLREMSDKHRQGIAPFVSDLNSWGTRLGVLRRMPSDWWNERTDVRAMVTAKFEKHLFSEKSLQLGIEESISKFRNEVEANNGELLTRVRASISASDLPALPSLDGADFATDVNNSIQQYASDSAQESVTRLVLTEISSGVSGAAASQIVIAIGARIATMTAATTATAGGATAGGTAIGGGGGTAVGPWGTAAGAAVGLVVGLVIDWWMTEQFDAKLRAELHELINQAESSVIVGTSDRPGLEKSLDEICDSLRDASSQSFFDRLVGDKSR